MAVSYQSILQDCQNAFLAFQSRGDRDNEATGWSSGWGSYVLNPLMTLSSATVWDPIKSFANAAPDLISEDESNALVDQVRKDLPDAWDTEIAEEVAAEWDDLSSIRP